MAFVCKANECECGNVSCFHLQRHLLCAIEKTPPHSPTVRCASTMLLQLPPRRDLLTYVAYTPQQRGPATCHADDDWLMCCDLLFLL